MWTLPSRINVSHLNQHFEELEFHQIVGNRSQAEYGITIQLKRNRSQLPLLSSKFALSLPLMKILTEWQQAVTCYINWRSSKKRPAYRPTFGLLDFKTEFSLARHRTRSQISETARMQMSSNWTTVLVRLRIGPSISEGADGHLPLHQKNDVADWVLVLWAIRGSAFLNWH
jgi:hypothetical protein